MHIGEVSDPAYYKKLFEASNVLRWFTLRKENTEAGCLDDALQLRQKSKGNVGSSAMLMIAKHSPN